MLVSSTPNNLLSQLEIRALGVDDLSTARYVVATAFARGAAITTPPLKSMASPSSSAARTTVTCCSAIAPMALGSARRWSASAPGASVRRAARRQALLAVFVHPFSAGNGIGTRLYGISRGGGGAAGYRALEMSATLNTAGFFEGLDYLETRRGLWGMPSGRRDAYRLHAQGRRRPARRDALTLSSCGP